MNKDFNQYIDDLLSDIELPSDEELAQETKAEKIKIVMNSVRTEDSCKKGGFVAGNVNKLSGQIQKLGSKNGKENGLKSRHKVRKPVYEFDLNGNLLREFIGAREAKKELGYCISACLRGRTKHAHNKFYTYDKNAKINDDKGKKVYNEVKTNTITKNELLKFCKKHNTTISYVLKNGYFTQIQKGINANVKSIFQKNVSKFC
jgi:hypothetical protein